MGNELDTDVDPTLYDVQIEDIAVRLWGDLRDKRLSLDSQRWVEPITRQFQSVLYDYAVRVREAEQQSRDLRRKITQLNSTIKKMKDEGTCQPKPKTKSS